MALAGQHGDEKNSTSRGSLGKLGGITVPWPSLSRITMTVKYDKAKIHFKSRRLVLTTAHVGSTFQRFLKAAVSVGE